MQKKLLTMAVAGALAAPVAAFAQVTVYGTIDTGIRNISKIVTGPGTDDSVLDVANNTRTTNRWGLKGSEDLGGGLMVNFTLEGQYASDTGAGPGSGASSFVSSCNPSSAATSCATASINANQGLFQRKAIVGLSKGGNSVDLGRDYTVNFKAQGIYDPMSYTYTGITPSAGTNTAGVRSNNLVTAGFRFGTGGVRVDYAAGEVVGENGRGTRIGFMGDFAFGPVTVTGAFSTLEQTATTDVTTTNIGGVYRMGAFTFRGGFSSTEVDAPGAKEESPMILLGAQYAISPTLNGRVGYYSVNNELNGNDAGETKTFIAALDYYLSKRTTLYVEVDRLDLDDLAKAGAGVGDRTDGSMGIGAGIAHAF